ncbi:MAG TPA: PLP-dependent aminotransferase family protein [Burkholderiaceae bacterium]|nr:PLP-dependent aminotransferase family protein [Burkholderiaceae bacterium]
MTATSTPGFTLARRAERMNPSIIREILKVTERPGIISLAGGLPSPDTFPVEAVREATRKVLLDTPREALQYAASEGYGPLRDWVAAHMNAQGLACTAGQVLITTGSQQGLDLAGKVLIDPGSPVLVETPTYLGALQAFAPYEPQVLSVPGDEEGPRPEALREVPGVQGVQGARFLYLLPNFQNPTGRLMGEARRAALVAELDRLGVPLLEDNPYGDLWFDAPPPAPLSARRPAASLYLGSFSKVLAPGLRLGYMVAPPALFPKLLQAKQAADLHTPGFNQRLVHEVIRDGFLDRHVPQVRAAYRAQRDAMRAALERHLGGVARWNAPAGGMFFWVELPAGLDAVALLPRAVEAGVAFVPGAAFYANAPQPRTLRLSFVTVPPERIAAGIEILAGVVKAALS